MQTTDSFSKAIILGATGGIGHHLATELAKHLDFLVLVGQNPDKLSQLQKELAGSKAQLSIKVLNLCDKEALENFGKVLDADLLVNCTGLASFSIGSDLATEKEQELWQVNYHAPVQLMKLLVQKNRKIRLVQLSSLAALFPHPYLAAYSASKAALQTYVLALHEELINAYSQVQISLYLLGPVQTPIFSQKLVDALGGSRFQMKPDRVARQLYRLFEQGTPYAVVGLRYRLLIYLGKLLPQKWIIHFISRYLRKGLNI